MKKLFCVVILMFVASTSFAARTMTIDPRSYESINREIIIIKLVCTAHTDGTFAAADIEDARPEPYWGEGYYLLDVWAVNSATDDHTNASVVTITDATGRQVIGTTAGDTLTLSQSASGIAYASMSRSAAQRAVTSQLTIAIADTGSTATVQTIYLVLGK